MTIYVQTPDHGLHGFNADDWKTDDGLGNPTGELWVGDAETETGVANFAPGAWLFVYEGEAPWPEPKPEPRVWKTLTELDNSAESVERHTKVRNESGYVWTLFTSEDTDYGLKRPTWLFSYEGKRGEPRTRAYNEGPFTEVLV